MEKMERLLKISLTISFLGIFILLLISIIQKPKQVNSYEDLKLNEQVKTTGKITSINKFEDFSIIRLNNNITVTCNCNLNINQTISVEGKVTEYKNQLQMQAEKIEVIEEK